MRKEGPFQPELSEERKNEIEQRAKADALSFLESRFKENLFKEKIPKAPKKDVLQLEFLEACWPVWEKAIEDLSMKTEEEKRTYRETFLIEGGYLK